MVGISCYPIYTSNFRRWISLAMVDEEISASGTELTIVWGEPDGGSRKPNVERHVQTEVRAIVGPCPIADEAREQYRPGARGLWTRVHVQAQAMAIGNQHCKESRLAGAKRKSDHGGNAWIAVDQWGVKATDIELGEIHMKIIQISATRVAALLVFCLPAGSALAQAVGVRGHSRGPIDHATLTRYAQVCSVSVSLRVMRDLGAAIIGLCTHTDPHEQLLALEHYSERRSRCNVVGILLYSFGGAVRTAARLRGEHLHSA
jgi:hypothetical protein